MALRTPTVRAVPTDAADATPRKVVLVSGDRIIAGPTGKVRMFLMRQRHVAEMTTR